DRVDPEAVQQMSRSQAESRQPAEMTDEHRREQGRRLVAEAAPQPLGVRPVLQPAVPATLKVREGALGEDFAGRLPVLQRQDRLCPVPAQAAGVVEQLEAFALSLTRAR